jgi:two-component system osmolarity sensor histidine kinase EnvZ
MTLWPRSLVGRNALLIVVLMVLAQLVSSLLVRELVVKPRLEQIADAVARNVAAMSAGLTALPPAERAAFLDAFGKRSVVGTSESDAAAAGAARLSPIERLFVRSVSARLAADDTEVIWRRDADRSLALRLRIGEQAYWLKLPSVLAAREFTGAWFAASAAAALLALLGALAIQRRIDRPLRSLVRAAETLGRGARPEPLCEDGPLEIASVSRSFNELVHKLDATERERALMLAGISHDLRTPLTKLRLGVEILADQVEPELAASLTRSIGEMDAIVGQFLDFARADDAAMPMESVALDALAREVAASFADHGQQLELALAVVPKIALRAPLVRRAVANLVENAFRHGRAPVRMSTGSDARWAWIEVTDAGDGIAATEVAAMKQPFRRSGSARSGPPGSGLGLSIVERIAPRRSGVSGCADGRRANPYTLERATGSRARLAPFADELLPGVPDR